MNNTLINVFIMVIFIAFCILISILLSRYSNVVQTIAMVFLVIIAIAADRLLLRFFRGYFVNQWYYYSSYSWKTGYGENILTPFIFIGGVIYSLVQLISFRIKARGNR
ncbi:MAG: hypothetical protein ACYDG2_24115 [Ruminiclostridium sp.]